MPDDRQLTAEVSIDEVRQLIEQEILDEALNALASLHPADQAELIADLDDAQLDALLPLIPFEQMADILTYLREEPRQTVVRKLQPSALGPLLDKVEPDVAADILHELPSEESRVALAAMRTAPEVTPLLPHPDETAGGRMTTDFVALHKEWTVDQALSYLRQTSPDAELVFYLYVVDDDHHLEGVVSLRQLVVARPEQRIAELMAPEVLSIGVNDDQEAAARLLQRYNFVALPAVDEGGRLVGVVSVDDLMDVAEEEATEDMYRMAGLAEDETLQRPISRSLAPRLSWLLINLLTALAAAAVVSAFQGTIQKAAILAVFMPIIAGMGGNAGIQTITLVVRSLALGQVELRDVRHVLVRELLIGLTSGIAIGLLLAGLAYVWEGNTALAIVAGVALLLNMAAAVATGVLVPLTLRAVRVDPALGSGVIVTTFTDVLGFFFLLGLAALLIDQIA